MSGASETPMLSAVSAPNDGRLLSSRYQLIQPIGAGGMAEVWRAHDGHLNRDVAIKLLQRKEHEAPKDIHTAATEARLAAKLVHPNIVRVYDLGSDGDLDF